MINTKQESTNDSRQKELKRRTQVAAWQLGVKEISLSLAPHYTIYWVNAKKNKL